MLIVILSINKLEIYQMDEKKNFFKMGTLMRKFIWNNKRGLLSIDNKKKFVSLSKHFMIWKQARKQWYEKFNKVMLSNKLKTNKINKCVYVKNTDIGNVIGCLYMEDILILDSNDHIIKSTKKKLTK